jgi:hypothetical protein
MCADVSLGPVVVKALERRGFLRLRKIENETQTKMSLDRGSSVLRIEGSMEAIKEAYSMLEVVSGPSIKVSKALWTELMRTRSGAWSIAQRFTRSDTAQVQSKAKANAGQAGVSAIAAIQQESGCQIQLERQTLEVRILGPQGKHHIAEQLLRKLSSMVSTVRVQCASQLDKDIVNKLAMEFHVTLEVDSTDIIVTGIRQAVEIATHELLNFTSPECKNWFHVRRSPQYRQGIVEARMHVEKAIARLEAVQCDQIPRQFSDDTTDAGSVSGISCCTSEQDVKQLENSTPRTIPERTAMTPDLGPCKTCGSTSFCGFAVPVWL